ncbi:MAG: patatin-like phospholipase family protein [Candidatus Harrisonbacteria bacterium]|nr:patatin-like phospholipase family protein [Candidatus Harrisonbacteria bacterium]
MNLGKVGMIFNGGGLAGCYSVGHVKALAAKGIKPDYVQGVSVGALTSAKLIANGWNIEELEKTWLEIQRRGPSSIFNAWDISKNVPRLQPSIYNDKQILEFIIRNIDLAAVANSQIKYHIIANNRNKKKFVAFLNHNFRDDPQKLEKVLQAAIGLYGFLPSVLIDGDWYGDGMGFMINEAIKARCDTIFILMNDQFAASQQNYGELPFYKQFISGFHDIVMRRDEEHIKYARTRGYDIIENNPSGRFDDANPLHKKIPRRIKHLMDSAVEAVKTDADVENIFSLHRIIILTPPSPIPTVHTLSFKTANPKIGYPGDVVTAIEQCSKLPDEFWNKL